MRSYVIVGLEVIMIFKPEDFEINELIREGNGGIPYISTPNAAKIGNEKLNELIESWPVVYGAIGTKSHSWQSYPPGTFIQENYTHKARLAFIEELPKEPCKHKPMGPVDKKYACIHCGIELVANWTAK